MAIVDQEIPQVPHSLRPQKEPDPDQISTLIDSLGTEAEDAFAMFKMEDDALYGDVTQKFEDHFIAKRNLIYETIRFRSRLQIDCESVFPYQPPHTIGTL